MKKTFNDTSLLNAYTHQISDAFEKLGRPISNSDAENLSYFLLRTMGSESRDYHRPEHSLDVSKNLFPVSQIAALFHDIVYVQVDSSWERNLSELLYPFTPSKMYSLDVRGALNHITDGWLKVIVKVFNLDTQTNLVPMLGLNEFLSAVVFYQKMKPYLKPEELLRGVCCIEATIPFRKADADGRTPAQRLVARVEDIQSGSLGHYFAEKIDSNLILKECKTLIENDLVSFGSETINDFLSNTWRVMIENNPALRNNFYSLSEYRQAIVGNIGFFTSLDAKNLYWTSASDSDLKHDLLIKRTESNLILSTEYMKAIAISVSLVEVIAKITGGESAYEFFFGPTKKSHEHSPINIESLIKFGAEPKWSAERSLIYKTLRYGREMRSRFDQKTSALSAYLYSKLSASEFEETFKTISLFHAGKINEEECLKAFDSQILAEVIDLLKKTALTRREQLQVLASRFASKIKRTS
jgi:hypothetical protein